MGSIAREQGQEPVVVGGCSNGRGRRVAPGTRAIALVVEIEMWHHQGEPHFSTKTRNWYVLFVSAVGVRVELEDVAVRFAEVCIVPEV